MTPAEFWWLYEVKRPKKMYGSMTEDDVRTIYEEDYPSV